MTSATTTALLDVDDLHVVFPGPRATAFGPRREVRAVDGVSFSLRPGETIGIVGESGSGKSTLARAVVGLEAITGGTIRLRGAEVGPLRTRGRLARDVQMVFQDPFGSVNPKLTIGRIIAEPIQNHERGLTRAEIATRVRELLVSVHLAPVFADRRPRSLSGGQLQRVGIARALALGPSLIVADEPVSALDVSVQAQVLGLLADLKEQRHIACLFIGHNLAVVHHVADRIAVMFGGRIVELGAADDVIARPRHPYTSALIDAVPRLKPAPGTRSTESTRSFAAAAREGCVYAARCPFATDVCRSTSPQLEASEDGHSVACHHAGEVAVTLRARNT